VETTTSSSGVAVVTDSTADLPGDLARKHGLTVVPLQVVLGGRVCSDGVDVSPGDVAAALAAGTSVSTSQPTPAAFAAAYQAAAGAGARAVVSVHISSQLSGTVASARLAAAQAPGIRVRVVDSATAAMGLGFAALAAAEAAATGQAVDAVEWAAVRTAGRTRVLIYVDALEYLRRGGRIGTAASRLGPALVVKPPLHIADGQVVADKARSRLVDLAVQTAGCGPVEIAVEHLAAAKHAERVATALRAHVGELRALHIGPIGAVVGAHIGPGALIVVVSPA
jgi:DegV family protein with EDD domain